MPSTPAASRFSSALSSFSFDHSVAETMSRLPFLSAFARAVAVSSE